MSKPRYGILPFEVMQSNLSPSAKVIYCCIQMFYNEEKGYAWPSNTQLMNCTNLSSGTIKSGLNELVAGKYINRETVLVRDHNEKTVRQRKINLLIKE